MNPHFRGHGKPCLEEFLKQQASAELSLRELRGECKKEHTVAVRERTLERAREFIEKNYPEYTEELKRKVYLDFLQEELGRLGLEMNKPDCSLCSWIYEKPELTISSDNPCPRNQKKYEQLKSGDANFCGDYVTIREGPHPISKKLQAVKQFIAELE